MKAGDEEAAASLWHRYFDSLVRHALGSLRWDTIYDEEDLAASVFTDLFAAAQGGSFTELAGRDELWRLLLHIARNKLISRHRYVNAARRGGKQVSLENAPEPADDIEPGPAYSAAVADECERLLNLLDSDELREIALLRFEGHTVEETAAQTGRGRRTILRRLEMIRRIWASELECVEADGSAKGERTPAPVSD